MAVLDNTNTMVMRSFGTNNGDDRDSPADSPVSCSSRFASDLDSLPRKNQERYELIRSIGFGGMKCVLLVHDKDTGREIAMALMPDFKERPPEVHEQFIREARITAYLNHPNIVAVHDIGQEYNGAPFYTMA